MGLDKLINNYSSWLTVDGQEGRYFTGDYTYLDNAPQVFFPAAGNRNNNDGNAYNLNFNSGNINKNNNNRANGYSVRCVQNLLLCLYFFDL